MEIIIYTIFMYGLSNIIVFGKPFNKIRNYLWERTSNNRIYNYIYELITCMMCLPTWLGGILSAINIFILKSQIKTPALFLINISEYNLINVLIVILVDLSFTSGVVWFISKIEDMLENKK